MERNKKASGNLDDCYVENAIKNGYKRKCSYPDSGVPELKKGEKRGARSLLVAAFGLDTNGGL